MPAHAQPDGTIRYSLPPRAANDLYDLVVQVAAAEAITPLVQAIPAADDANPITVWQNDEAEAKAVCHVHQYVRDNAAITLAALTGPAGADIVLTKSQAGAFMTTFHYLFTAGMDEAPPAEDAIAPSTDETRNYCAYVSAEIAAALLGM
jgi:hypothetical protein